MRHYKKGRKLGTDSSHTKAMKKSLVAALLKNDRIKTTESRAKEIRGDVDKIITWAKRGDVHARRLAIAALGDKDLVAEVFSKVEQGLFKDRPGGYTRILKLGNRKGDAAPIVIMELVLEPVVKKQNVTDTAVKAKKPAGKSAAKATAKSAAKDMEGEGEDMTDKKAEDKIREAAEKAKDKAGEVAEKAKDKAEEVTEKAKDKAGEVAEKAKDKAGEVAEKAKEGVENTKDAVTDAAGKAKDKAGEAAEKVDEATESK